MAKRSSCSADALPLVRLTFEKDRCMRRGTEKLSSPLGVAEFVSKHYGCRPQEVFLTIALTASSEPIAVHEVSIGGVAQAAVDPKMVFAGALLAGATALILIHNHPSGNAEPSAEDVSLTRQLVTAGQYLGIRVLDHVVIGRGQPLAYTSFVQRGLMPTATMGGFGDEEQAPYGERKWRPRR